MKSSLMAIALLLAGSAASAATNNLKIGQVYRGREMLNEQFTGNSCFITIQHVEPSIEKGLHCSSADFQFASVRDDVPKDVLHVESRLTNSHRPEFPNVRTCAMNVDGTTSRDDIYGEATAALYNQIFAGQSKIAWTQYDVFLTLSPQTKEAVLARIHIQGLLTEKNIDCVNLEKM